MWNQQESKTNTKQGTLLNFTAKYPRVSAKLYYSDDVCVWACVCVCVCVRVRVRVRVSVCVCVCVLLKGSSWTLRKKFRKRRSKRKEGKKVVVIYRLMYSLQTTCGRKTGTLRHVYTKFSRCRLASLPTWQPDCLTASLTIARLPRHSEGSSIQPMNNVLYIDWTQLGGGGGGGGALHNSWLYLHCHGAKTSY